MRELIKRLLYFLGKLRFFKNPAAFIPLTLFVLILLFAGIFAITQEAEEELGEEDLTPEDLVFDFFEEEEEEIELLPEWLPPGPPRWFRSNAGGMALEETPSRLSALHNQYALVIDYLPPFEVDPRLAPYYQNDYTVEIRILYEAGRESRRQWLFKDEDGVVRINAVFKPETPEEPPDVLLSGDDQIETHETALEDKLEDKLEDELAEIVEEKEEDVEVTEIALSVEEMPDPESSPAAVSDADTLASVGFIEIFNEKNQIIEDRWIYEDDSEIVIHYLYNGSAMIQAETQSQSPGLLPVKMYTDIFRYNRSFSLRHVERLYHRQTQVDPVRLVFPSRVLDAAANQSFFSDKLYLASEFFNNFIVAEDYRMVYDTDERGRILIQTLVDSQNEAVWIIKNTWSGDRIISALKIEGEDEKLSEYEYNSAGERIVLRDIHNGVLERVVYTEGAKEIEELYLDGVVAMKAYWEDGRKISEERVRRQ